ncbi:MAG: protein-export chaperone SecB [Rhodospirillales bacterium]|nr:protein-export chaperone SecB [Rhodospirillales bacterium]
MADTPKGQGNGSISGGGESGSNEVPAEEAKAPLVINNQFIKDLSFEAPSVPEIFQKMQTVSPNINVNVNVQARQLVDDIYEVTLHTEAECKTGDSTAFLVELDYAGVFTVNVPSEHLRPILLIECPRLLFPFARHIVANVTRDGGFPPVLLGPIDFVSMYQRQLQEQAEAAAAAAQQHDDGAPIV